MAEGESAPTVESAAVGESAPLGKSEATGSFGVTDVAGLAGLSSKEAKARLAELVPNLLVERERRACLAQWLRMLADPMALMLAGASALYMLLGKPHEAAVLAAVI
ncbi:MAG: cation-transporting P-type ATPase, partial [Candidatus Binataceae bacterium]